MAKTIIHLMECNHIAQGTSQGKPVCLICDCTKVKEQIDISKPENRTKGLEGRKAICSGHKWGSRDALEHATESSWSLPFFQHRPDKEYDTYYCGCYGWD